jgi:hypothetical protein
MVVLLPFAAPWQAQLLTATQAMPAVHGALATLATLPSAFFWFPAILAVSMLACFVATWLTKADDMEVLKAFYKKTRPWGFWGPVCRAVQADDPSFKPNPDFWRDMFNIVVGIVWQTSLVAMPVYVVIREYDKAKIALGIVIATSLILYFTWLRHLKKIYPDEEFAPAPKEAVPAE